MDIGQSPGYGMALVTASNVLTVTVLKDKVAAYQNLLAQRSIRPRDKALVFVSDETELLPLLWALVRSRITCIAIDPAQGAAALADIARRCGAACVVTEKQYIHAAASGAVETIIIGEATAGNTPFTGYDGELADVPFIFAGDEDPGSTEFITSAALDSFFSELDALVSSPREELLLLSRCLPFPRRVMEMVWASSRAITVAVDSLDSDAALSRYTASADEFRMDFGLFHFGSYVETSETHKYKQLFDTVQFADKNEFSSVWTPERHFNEFGGMFPNPSVLSAALAVTTSRVQIRSGSLVSPLHHPVRIAEDWALTDNLSNGRVAISFASGWQCDDFVFFPENYAERHQCMMDQIEAVRRLWKGEKLPFKNGLGKEVEVAIFPKPVQKELPVWITVSGRTETFIDAGRIGANILTHLLWQDTEELIEKIAAYRQSLAENGFDPRSRTVSVMVHTYLGADNESVREKVRAPLKHYIRTSTQLIQSMARSNADASNSKDVGGRYGDLKNKIAPHLMDELAELAFNRFFEQAALLGTIEKAKGMIRKLKGYDVDEIAALIDFGLPGEDIMQGLEYLNELRKMYDERNFTRFPATITHCSLQALENSGHPLSHFFRTQDMIWVEAESTESIPAQWRQASRAIHHTSDEEDGMSVHVSAPEALGVPVESAFNASLSDDF
jgi:natural product biosynthesis luciferase-like monooxygenase protein